MSNGEVWVNKTPINIHIINHTHWDREWFLTSIYTSRWIPRLIDKLEQLMVANPDFRFLLDGQTLVIEDLLAFAPEYADRVRRLISSGRLLIGPYYCQPDWQLTSGELLIRNLKYGQQDIQKYGITMDTGWLVDTFGHISQSPQIHRLFGIESVFIWRGMPRLEPYFHWHAPDDSQVLGINLFGGYRNLYGVTHIPEVAVKRLLAEVEKLRPFYPTPDIPLFDGYDLEDNPEDPLTFYTQADEIGKDIALHEATPLSFAREISRQNLSLPGIDGELNSGKFGATFPGTFSARTYLKFMAYDCSRLLYQQCEPLAGMAALFKRSYQEDQYEKWSRLLLQNAVHDCICGVSIDLVHEKMEDIYARVFEEAVADIQTSLATMMGAFTKGTYAISSNPYKFQGYLPINKKLYRIETNGIGVWPLAEPITAVEINRPVKTFKRGEFVVQSDGTIHYQGVTWGQLLVTADEGDTYSDEAGEKLGVLTPTSPLTHTVTSAYHDVVAYQCAFDNGTIRVQANVQLTFMDGEMPRCQIELDSRGTNFRVDFVCQPAIFGTIFAGMPFDVVERPAQDTDFLPAELTGQQAKIFMGQRELNEVRSFPFQEFVGVREGKRSVVVCAKGGSAYQVDAEGTIRIILRRSSEWLTKANLKNRIGDAGPFFYVPDARCERVTKHELALLVANLEMTSPDFQCINHSFHNPPVLVHSQGQGALTSWQLAQEDMPLSSLRRQNGRLIMRGHNPSADPIVLTQKYQTVDPLGQSTGGTAVAGPKQIISLVLPPVETADATPAPIQWLNPPMWRVGPNHSRPDPVVLDQLKQKVDSLDRDLAQIQSKLEEKPDDYHLRWQLHAAQRERLEHLLSIHLNELKIKNGDTVPHDYLYQPDPKITEIGGQLNKMRIKRRIFDYVIAVL